MSDSEYSVIKSDVIKSFDCTIPDLEYHMGKRQKHKKIMQKSQEVNLSQQVITRLQGTDKTA